MRIVSRLVVMAGAFLGSVRQSDRPDPGGYIGQSLTTLRVATSPASPVFKVGPFGTVSRLARSKTRIGRRRSSSRVERSTPLSPSTHHSHPPFLSSTHPSYTNQTVHVPRQVALGAPNYDGPKELAIVDARRDLAIYRPDGPRDLALYNRPNSLALYTGPINFVRFWVDTRHYQVVAHVYRHRFTDGAPMFSQYGHLEPRDFERWAFQAAEDPVETMLASHRSVLREVFGIAAPKPLTIGEFKRRPEEQASRVLASICVLGLLVSGLLVVGQKCLELLKATEHNRPVVFVEAQGSDILATFDVQLEEASSGNRWWEGYAEGKRDARASSATTYVDTSLSNSAPSIPPSPTPDLATVQVSEAPGSSRRSPTKPTLSRPPGGPRFKSAAWKRCRVK